MKALPTQQLPAPSAGLLRYLKAQSEACWSVAPEPRALWTKRSFPRERRYYTAFSGSRPDGRTTTPYSQRSQHGLPRACCARDSACTTAPSPTYHTPPKRPFSTTAPSRNWLWNLATQKRTSPLHTTDLPPIASFLDDTGSTNRILKPSNELRLRCTELDENGNVVLVNGEFKKTELIARYGLLPRDLRKIDSSLLPHILVRPSAILINLLHLRVLIKSDRVLVFDAYGSTDSYTQSVFMYDLEGKLRQKQLLALEKGGLPYEFRALEAVLVSVTGALESEFEGVRDPVVRVLQELEEDIDRDKLRHLLIYSKKLGTFEQKARLVRDAIDDLLEADDDLAAMYLTEKSRGVERAEDDHTEVEMLLESYYKVCDEIVQASSNLVSNIRNTEEIVKAILDANRNSLMLLDLKFSIGTLGIGTGTFVAALYGMNLKNFLEESSFGFFGISAWCTVFGIFTCLYGLQKLRKVQRVSMWGENPLSSRRSFGSRQGLGTGGGSGGVGMGLQQPIVNEEKKVDRFKRLKSGGFGQGVRHDPMLDGGGSGTDGLGELQPATRR